MAQKDKVKELVGRGLGSYHTKSLQQMDRIEKKNKEQNHKINILTNELDNDYLTKTEEGSVISLDHSKEGMVYLDELQGNTLVNYCVDGSKELNLNGDIDVEGTNVTLTEGVDNGLVDVMLQGNTLVNVCNQKDSIAITKSYTVENTNHVALQGEYDGKCRPVVNGNTMVNYCNDGNRELVLNNEINVEGFNITLNNTADNGLVDVVCEGNTLVNTVGKFAKLGGSAIVTDEYIQLSRETGDSIRSNGIIWKPSTVYTVVYTILETNFTSGNGLTLSNGSNIIDTHYIHGTTVGTHKATFTTKADSSITTSGLVILISSGQDSTRVIKLKDIYVLEGDWTNKEVPSSYFEGMKSVGECEDNKVEIISKKEHLVWEQGTIANATGQNNTNETRVRTKDYFDGNNVKLVNLDTNKYYVLFMGYDENKNYVYSSGWIKTPICPENHPYVRIVLKIDETTKITERDITEDIHFDRNYDKKEILLNEPLRAVGDVKDKIVKIGGKWYIERNCGETVIGKENDYISVHGSVTYNDISYTRFRFEIDEPLNNLEVSKQKSLYGISNKFEVIQGTQANKPYSFGNKAHHLDGVGKIIVYGVVDEKVTTIELAREYFANNKVSLVYKLETPTYEEITDTTLTTYFDTTYISNNSIIPCNMQVKNSSGYNVIIKPSTLYTVALDTNKSGAIDINLGGAKVTTTNNVAMVTTPSVLTNNNLELHGEGIKVSNVMVFEGDTTSNLPNEYVDGLMSCFEDQLVTDENDPNYGKYKVEYKVSTENLFTEDFVRGHIDTAGTNVWKSNPNTRTAIVKVKPSTTYTVRKKGGDRFWLADHSKYPVAEDILDNVYIGVASKEREYVVTTGDNANYLIFYVSSGGTSTETVDISIREKEYTKTFYLNSPLLEGDTIEDINGKATHLKRYKQVVLNGSENWIKSQTGGNNYLFYLTVPDKKQSGHIMCDNFKILDNYSVDQEGISSVNDINLRVDTSKLTSIDTDGLKIFLSSNPTTVVYELASPIYETISEESILCDNYANGHLDLNTNIPVEKVEFMPLDLNLNYLYPNTVYAIQFKSDIAINGVDIKLGGAELLAQNIIAGINKFNITTPTTLLDTKLIINKEGANISNVSVVATELDIEYFEGIKSVGQDDEDGHSVEVLSQNKNLVQSIVQGGINNTNGNLDNVSLTVRSADYISIKSNTTYTISNDMSYNNYIYEYDKDKKFIKFSSNRTNPCTFTTTNNTKYITFRSTASEGQSDLNVKYQIEEGAIATSYIKSSINKKEISLNEPLRGLPNGVKDRIVKIGGKWYVERNCGEILLDGSTDEYFSIHYAANENNDYIRYRCGLPDNAVTSSDSSVMITAHYVCDKFNSLGSTGGGTPSVEGIAGACLYTGDIRVCYVIINKNKLSAYTIEGFREWLATNPTRVVYQLEKSTYEPLEVYPTLNTYTDITYISNNSITPCSMKIQNSGYNSIIKPSTLYTVALDTSTNGTIGINLGGVKTTTINNVATITTPSILTDDSLRLHGKGIKASRVRLLEGDKTNFIPSFFEGMQSSFEDKLQDDGSYKMEILSNNTNIIKELKAYQSSNSNHSYVIDNNTVTLTSLREHKGYIYAGFNFGGKLKPNTTYYVSSNIIKSNPNTQACIRIYDIKKVKDYAFLKQTGSQSFTTPSTEVENIKILLYSSMDNVTTNNGDTITYENIQISEVDTNYVEPKYNKIQFSFIEPLRDVGDVKDRFVFKDGKLMIERNCGEVILNGGEDWTLHSNTTDTMFCGWVDKGNIDPNKISSQNFKVDRFNRVNGTSVREGLNLSTSGFAYLYIYKYRLQNAKNINGLKEWLKDNPTKVVYQLTEPTYEEIPFELQKIILEGYENATLFFDTNIPPTVTTTYAGETPIVKSVRLNKTEVLKNTDDINDNIVPYLMDMDYRVVCLQLEGGIENISMARLFGGTYEMLQRDIKSKRYSVDEYKHRLDIYLSANKVTEDEYEKLGGMLYE